MTETRYEGYKEGFREGFREGLREKSGNEIREELRKELEEEVRQELRDELVDEVKAELREELYQECKDGRLREYLDDFQKGFVEGFKEEYPKGIRKGELEILSKLAADGRISIADAAKEARMTEAEFCTAIGMTPAPQSAPTTPQAPAADAAAEKAPDATPDDGANTTAEDAPCEETPCDGASLETAKNEAFVEGETLGIEEGVLRTLRLLVVDGALTIADAADIAGVTIAEFDLRATSSPSQWTSEYEQALKLIAERRGLAASSSATATLQKLMAQARSGGLVQGLQRVLTTLVAAERITPHNAERYGEEFLAEYASFSVGGANS